MVVFKHNGTRNKRYIKGKGIFAAALKWVPTPSTHKGGLNYEGPEHWRWTGKPMGGI